MKRHSVWGWFSYTEFPMEWNVTHPNDWHRLWFHIWSLSNRRITWNKSYTSLLRQIPLQWSSDAPMMVNMIDLDQQHLREVFNSHTSDWGFLQSPTLLKLPFKCLLLENDVSIRSGSLNWIHTPKWIQTDNIVFVRDIEFSTVQGLPKRSIRICRSMKKWKYGSKISGGWYNIPEGKIGENREKQTDLHAESCPSRNRLSVSANGWCPRSCMFDRLPY